MRKTVVVTGCSSGFGRQVSELLARKGNRVYATMRGIEGKNAEVAGSLQALATAEGIDLRVMELDVTSTNSVDSAAAGVLAESGAPDVVIQQRWADVRRFHGGLQSRRADKTTRHQCRRHP